METLIMWYVYLLSCADNTFYCGITNNLEKRLHMHNGILQGGAKYTRGRRPVNLLAYAHVPTKSEALRLEKVVKKKPKKQKKEFLLSYAKTVNIPYMTKRGQNYTMNTLTIAYPPLKKGDFCKLIFAPQNIASQVPSSAASLENHISKPHLSENCLSYQEDVLTQQPQKAYSSNCEYALKLSTGTILYKNNTPAFLVHGTAILPAKQISQHIENTEEKSLSQSEVINIKEEAFLTSFPSLFLECLCDDLSDNNYKKNPKKSKKAQEIKEVKIEKIEETKQALCHDFTFNKQGYSLAVITLSDKGFQAKREDRSGPALLKLVGNMPLQYDKNNPHPKPAFITKHLYILPDEISALRGLVASLAYTQGVDCIITTGGTGLSMRDITPDALLPLLSSRMYGFEHAMMAKSLEKTPHAMLSRAFSGIIHKSLLICVPGSVKAATENIEAILPALPHALAKLTGDMSDCGA